MFQTQHKREAATFPLWLWSLSSSASSSQATRQLLALTVVCHLLPCPTHGQPAMWAPSSGAHPRPALPGLAGQALPGRRAPDPPTVTTWRLPGWCPEPGRLPVLQHRLVRRPLSQTGLAGRAQTDQSCSDSRKSDNDDPRRGARLGVASERGRWEGQAISRKDQKWERGDTWGLTPLVEPLCLRLTSKVVQPPDSC